MVNNVFTEERIEELSFQAFAEFLDQLNKPFSYEISYGTPVADLVASPSYAERIAELLKPIVEKYVEDLKTKGFIQTYSPVVVGSFTSSLILKDKGKYPHHRATANFSNGVKPRTAGYKGKWRRAKKLLRRWVDDQRAYLALDVDFQPVDPLSEIKFEYIVKKPLAEYM